MKIRTLRGLLHAHSQFSHDGEHSLEEIARFAKRKRYDFIGMTEHSDTFNAETMAKLVKGCAAMSDRDFLMIPGLEFTCEDDFHILGLGIESFKELKKPQEIIQFIHNQRGVAVIAHPRRYNYKIPQALLAEVDGIEVWSAVYDGRYVPNDQSLAFIKEFRRRNGSIIAFGGEDLHRITNLPKVEIRIPCAELNKDILLGELMKTDFEISNNFFHLNSSMENGGMRLTGILIARRFYVLAKKGREFLKRIFSKS
jgi:predicted metal-dependent phosphoesterase TrpH